MKTVVCVKQVNGEINPFDACALECALRIQNNEITVISMGRENVRDMLLGLTRLGISKAILLSDNAFAGSDTLATSYVLSKAVQRIKPDLVLCGRQAIDGDTAQTGACLSEMINYNLVTNVLSIDEINNESISFTTRLGKENIRLPLVATIERINVLRFPSIRSKMREVEIFSANDLELDKSKCGISGSPTRVIKTYESQLGRRKCKFVSKNELSKIILEGKNKSAETFDLPIIKNKLPLIHIVGNELYEKATLIGEKISIINSFEPNEITEIITAENAKFVLFPANIIGRRIAPLVQAKLKTGLCADCTSFSTDGKKLFMIRPALGGSLIAEIECLTTPVLATARVASENTADVILSAGLGAVNVLEKLKEFANDNEFEFAASRGLVDKIGLPYENQIGLTGKSVSPKVYLACGISGAVHHTCAIEKAGTIIAINKDKNARIFDYADYGIVDDIKNILNMGK